LADCTEAKRTLELAAPRGQHTDLASRGQKLAIGFIERLAALRDRRYERVIFAKTPVE